MQHIADEGREVCLVPHDDFQVPQVQIVRDRREIDECRLGHKTLPSRKRDRRTDTADQKERREEWPMRIHPLVLARITGRSGNGSKTLHEQHHGDDRRDRHGCRHQARTASQR